MPCAFKAFISFCCLPFFLGHSLKLEVLERAVRKESLDVWILSYPRSGSSTLLSLVKSGAPESSVFALFEPGDHRDEINLDRRKDGVFAMGEVIKKLSTCNFTGVHHLHFWDDEHTSNNGKKYSVNTATDICQNARLRVFKTVGDVANVDDANRRIEQLTTVLDARPKLKILNLVRDPRSVLASWKTLEAFGSALSTREVPLWREMCDTYAANLKFRDPRVLNVVFEKLVKRPRKNMNSIFSFLGLPFGAEQEKWLEATFPATDAGCEEQTHKRYADCHGYVESVKEMVAWRSVLNAHEKKVISEYAPCQEVIEAYAFDEE